VAIKHKSEAPPDARDTNPLVPEPLVRIIYRCLQKNPADRYPDADVLAADLAALENDLPTLEREISRIDTRSLNKAKAPAGRMKSRRPWLAAAGLIAVAAAAVWILLRKPAPAQSPSQGLHTVSPQVYYKGTPDGQNAPRASRPGSLIIGPADLGKANDLIAKFFKSADPKDLAEVQKQLTAIRVFLPEKGPYMEAWKSLNDEVAKHSLPAYPSEPPSGRRVSGAPTPSRTKPAAMQTDMETLMAMVAEREAAESARKAMGAAKTVAQKAGAGEKTMLFRLARFEEGNAEEAFQKNDYTGAKALCEVLEKTFALSAFGGGDASGIGSLKQYVGGLKAEASSSRGGADPWLLEIARETENQADGFLAKKDLENAGGAYLRAAFLFQRIKDAAARPR
jgi:hypothetical protein